MRKFIFLLMLATCVTFTGKAYAQFEDFEDGGQHSANNRNGGGNGGNGRLIDRLRFGGDFGLGFSNNGFAMSINPNVGYQFNQYVTAGVIATCEYYRYGETSYRAAYSKSNFGGGLFADIYPIDFLVLHAEAQYINYDDYTSYSSSDRRSDMPILIGGGYHRRISDRAGINLMFLWNLNETDGLRYNTSFSNPIIRFSVIF